MTMHDIWITFSFWCLFGFVGCSGVSICLFFNRIWFHVNQPHYQAKTMVRDSVIYASDKQPGINIGCEDTTIADSTVKA